MGVNTVYNTPIRGQVGVFNPITMYTPQSDGNYRVTLCMHSEDLAMTAQDILINVTYTHAAGYEDRVSCGLFPASGSDMGRAIECMRVKGGTDIVLSYGGSQTDVTAAYDVYPNLEQL